ncbi:MAG: PilZ domain-containing protein [Planctomycetes bacterium]|jgi:hypothetical protein|nr:PilZ domain-containing protein [Planctomycetota bacterium]
MEHSAENRQERRLPYRWPIWFGEDLTKAVFLGLMEDISSGGIAFTHTADSGRLKEGARLTVRFSVPRFLSDDPQTMVGMTRTGVVRWTTPLGGGTYRVGVQFDVPLSLKPAEEATLPSFCREPQ